MKRLKTLPLPDRLKRRIERQWLIGRAIRRRHALTTLINRTSQIHKSDILAFVTQRNERARLPYFLEYYRDLGIRHFLFVDNASNDGSAEYLAAQSDVSLWQTSNSYRHSRFGMDWIGWLLFRYGHGHWCLTVDPDEFLIYPHCDSRPLRALTDWLDDTHQTCFSAMLLDMYSKGPIDQETYHEGQNPFEILRWFDPANYMIHKNFYYGNLWIQGGVRGRLFFDHDPVAAPALNKIPLVRWNRRYTYVSSTHMLLPRALNKVYADTGGELASGCLMHAKFLSIFGEKASEELDRQQHHANSREYIAYHRALQNKVSLWCRESREYTDWRQLEDLGLLSSGNWP